MGSIDRLSWITRPRLFSLGARGAGDERPPSKRYWPLRALECFVRSRLRTAVTS